MRLQQLLVEDETITLQGKRTVTLSMADLYDMTNQIPPMEENKNGRMAEIQMEIYVHMMRTVHYKI